MLAQLKLKAMVFQNKTHNIEHAYAAILMLGFKEVVRDLHTSTRCTGLPYSPGHPILHRTGGTSLAMRAGL